MHVPYHKMRTEPPIQVRVQQRIDARVGRTQPLGDRQQHVERLTHPVDVENLLVEFHHTEDNVERQPGHGKSDHDHQHHSGGLEVQQNQ